jgi:hypothetical protein
VIAPISRTTPLRVILDTNVLLSGIFFGISPPTRTPRPSSLAGTHRIAPGDISVRGARRACIRAHLHAHNVAPTHETAPQGRNTQKYDGLTRLTARLKGEPTGCVISVSVHRRSSCSRVASS